MKVVIDAVLFRVETQERGGWGGVGTELGGAFPRAASLPLSSSSVVSPEGTRWWSCAKVSQDVQ